jgi:hypothetical protein
MKSRAWPMALVILVAMVGLILYWPAIGLPLIYDDLLHIRIVKGLNLANVWLPTDEFGFYRPLTFFPLLIIKSLFGYYPSELLHGINIVQHALNAALLGALAWRLWRRTQWAAASGLLFVLFPFSFQAVAVYGHNVHPATAGLLLAALHTAYLWWIVTAILFLAGLLSHESAVLFGFFAALVHWNDRGRLPELDFRRPAASLAALARQPWFAFLLAGVVYTIGYQFLDLSRSPQASFAGDAPWYKFLYLGQGAAYPVTWLGRWLPEVEPAVSGLVLGGLTVMAGLTFWSARAKENRLPLLLGWGWWALASILIALPLDTSYLLHGPRLLYLSSIGLALLWPVLLEPIYSINRTGRLVWAVSLIVVLSSNWIFIRNRLDDYARLTSPIDEIKTTMKDKPDEEGVLLVNLPQWLDQPDNTYLVGVDLVAMLGNYLFVEELLAENLLVDRPAQAIKVPDLLGSPPYNYAIHEQPAGETIKGDWAPRGSRVFITTYQDEGPELQYTGLLISADGQKEPVATFGPYHLLETLALSCDDKVHLTTTWREVIGEPGAGSIPPTTSIFAQLLDSEGQIADQADGPLLNLRPDLVNLPPGWQVVDERELLASENQLGGLLIGVYDFASGERYSAWNRSGVRLADDALLISLQDCS